jgi:glycosyltransferase involved in cell wall biosynthesis
MKPRPEPSVEISAVVICYNQERYIADAIESVLAQTASDRVREIFVVDDCSSDNTVDVAKTVARRDPRVVVIRRETNSGGCAAPRNDGIAQSTGTHIALLDGDDIWMPEKIAHQVEALEARPDIGLLFSDYVVFDDETGAEQPAVARHYDVDDPNQLRNFFIHGGPVVPSCAVVSRAAVEVVGVFDPDMRFNEDSEYWLRIASAYPIHHQARPLVRKREWFGSLGSTKYGLENLECKREITQRMVARVPDLASAVPLREAQIEYKTAVHHFALKDTPAARRHLRNALSIDPRLRKARLYLALSYLASDPETLLRLVRKARTKVPAALR